MLSVRRVLLSARIIPVMLKGSITAFWTVSNITIRTLPSLPVRVLHEDGYVRFAPQWSLSFSYGITMREDTRAPINPDRMRYPYGFTHSLNMSGNLKLTNKWNMNFSSGWDFENHDFTTTTLNITRDLHCFTMTCSGSVEI